MANNQFKNLDNLADKAITDDELEQVSGGGGPTWNCTCGGVYEYNNGVWICNLCKKQK